MHGLQPIAKIAPSPNDANQPPRELTTWPPIRSPIVGDADAGAEGRRARRGRQRARRAGVERPPRPAQDGDVQESRQVEAEDDEDDAADGPQRRQVVDERTGREGRGDAEDREHGPESGHVRERVSDREPARGRRARGRTRDRDRRQLAEVRRHERQHARRQEADDAGGEGDEDREVGAAHRSVRRPGRRSAGGGAWPRSVASSSRRSPSSTTGIALKNARSQAGSVSMSRSTRVGTARPARARCSWSASEDRARLVAQAAAGAAVQDEVGEGNVAHLAVDCRRGSAKGPSGGTMGPRPRSSVDRARPS